MPGATWNRRVSATADGNNLQVDEVTSNPNPPGRNDTASDITVRSDDKPALINYLGDGVRVTGIAMKDGGDLPAGLTFTANGNNGQVRDDGPDGVDYSYYVVGDYADHHGIQTEDPQIHNRVE